MEFESCIHAPSDWERVTIASVCDRFTSGGTPSRRRPEFFENGVIPWVKTKELLDCVLDDAEEWITEHAILASSAKRLPANTILMAMYGATVGQLGILGREMACNQACAAMIVDDAVCDYRFLYYQLLANRRQIVSMATGAAQQNLSGAQIKSWVLPLPDREEQARIAGLLWALDERIASLRHTNATLEAIAQALFKSWFVDFDPVRAKAEGREPEGMDATTAVLFTSEFEDSELGVIPKDWKSVRLADLCSKIQNGATPSRKNGDFWEGGTIPWFKTGELADGFLEESSELITEEALGKTSVKVLPRHAVLMAIYAAPTVGRLGVLTRESAFNQACTGMIAKTDVGPWFLFQTLRHGRDWFNSRANGAAQQNISKSIVESLPCIKPPAELLAAFSKIAGALYRLAEANSQRIEILSNLRDALLPRLIFGKLRLPESEREIEAPTA